MPLEEATIGQKIRAAREARGWTVSDLARHAGLYRTSVIQIEEDQQARENMRFVTVVGLVDALAPDVGLEDFANGMTLRRIASMSVKLRRER